MHLSETPYIKLDLLLLRALRNLDADTGGRRLNSVEDLKILPSQSLHALHFLKVAGELLPKPNRFDQYYRANLYDGKALLRTVASPGTRSMKKHLPPWSEGIDRNGYAPHGDRAA